MKKIAGLLGAFLILLAANVAGAAAGDDEGWARRRRTRLVENCEKVPITQVPEPSALLLLGSGLIGVGLLRRRKL